MSNPMILSLIWLVAVGTAVVLVSFFIEALRPVPATPERLPWAPDIPIEYVTINGIRLRYIHAGEGPTLVLLHTLRTQLDLFQKVVPKLAKHLPCTPSTTQGMAIPTYRLLSTTPRFSRAWSKVS